jgi:hypothetical protein
MVVVSTPIVPTISLSGSTTVAVGSLVTINATVSGAGSSYLIRWYNHGTMFNTTTVPNISYTKTIGIDSITAKVVSTTTGCYDSTISGLFVIQDNESVNTLTNTSIVYVYPNPATHTLHIDKVPTTTTYKLTDIVGSEKLHGTLQKGNNSIHINTLAQGIYLLELTNNDGVKEVRKVVKE